MRYNNIVLLTLQAGCLSRRSETKTDGRAARSGDQILTRLRKTTPRQAVAQQQSFVGQVGEFRRRHYTAAPTAAGLSELCTLQKNGLLHT